MLLWLMIVCAVGAVLLFAMGALSDLADVWKHPEHRVDEEFPHHYPPLIPSERTPPHHSGTSSRDGRGGHPHP